MYNLKRILMVGVCAGLMASLALPALAHTETPYLDQNAVEMIENSVASIVMNDLHTFYGIEAAETCAQTETRSFCLDPNTPPERAQEILRNLPTWIDPEEGGRYERDGRWTSTASGYSGILGNPITLTYSFVPDGTWIPGEGEASSLYATLNSQFGGDTAAWQEIFAECFARWAEYIGITYIYEPSDDGASFPSTVGVLGSRGDVRIAMANIDGIGGTLAYNWYPAYGGDMVMDSSENWGNASSDYRFFRNVVMHEHGHGHGLGHVEASNIQLMEPYYQGTLLGPQDDDLRGGMRNYGDYLELNNTVADATDLGTLGEGLSSQENVSLTASSDTDYYRFTLASNMITDIYIQMVGSYYLVGPEGGSQSPINTTEIMDLGFELYDAAGTLLLETVNDGGLGDTEQLIDYSLDAGTYHVRVRRHAGNDVQRYKLSFFNVLDDLTAVGDGDIPAKGLGLSVYPTPFNPKTTARFYVQEAGAVNLEIFNVQGRVVKSFTENRAAGWMTIDWNGRDDNGSSVPSGLYFLRASNARQSETVRALLLK